MEKTNYDGKGNVEQVHCCQCNKHIARYFPDVMDWEPLIKGQLEVYFLASGTFSFCSKTCAKLWFESNPNEVIHIDNSQKN